MLGLRRNRRERVGFSLYRSAVVAARDQYFYAKLGVPDTLDGRFDLVGLHVFLLIDRLRRAPGPGADLAQAVFDAMFSDMDMSLREIGVGDLSVGRKVKAMWEAFHGRAVAYSAALEGTEATALATAIERNVWRGTPAPAGSAEELARFALALREHLAAQELTSLAVGEVRFLPVGGAM